LLKKLVFGLHGVPKDFTTTISRLLTLSSEYFSSFVHTTCTLSVSRMYLALGVVYLPLALKFQTTRLSSEGSIINKDSIDEAFTLYGVPFQGTYGSQLT